MKGMERFLGEQQGDEHWLFAEVLLRDLAEAREVHRSFQEVFSEGQAQSLDAEGPFQEGSTVTKQCKRRGVSNHQRAQKKESRGTRGVEPLTAARRRK